MTTVRGTHGPQKQREKAHFRHSRWLHPGAIHPVFCPFWHNPVDLFGVDVQSTQWERFTWTLLKRFW